MNIDNTPKWRAALNRSRPASAVSGDAAGVVRNVSPGSRYARGTRIGMHAHAEAQLLFAAHGLMQVSTAGGHWFVPPRRAVWIPPRTPHAVDVVSELNIHSLLIPQELIQRHGQAERLSRAFLVTVSPLLHSAIFACRDPATDPRLRDLLLEVALYQLDDRHEAGSTYMPMPGDARARRVAELVLADATGDQPLSVLADLAGSSVRTISRLFAQETGLSFKSWRQRARIMLALEMLGRERAAVKAVASRLGFSSVAAFGHAFRQVTGMRPSEVTPTQE